MDDTTASTSRRHKVLVIGNCACNKSTYILNFNEIRYFGVSKCLDIPIGEVDIELEIVTEIETGDSEYRRLQQLCKADIVVICFCCDCPDSFVSVQENWLPMVEKFAKEAPVLIVGTAVDFEYDGKPAGSETQARHENFKTKAIKLAKDLEFYDCLFCIYNNWQHAWRVFDSVARATLVSGYKNNKKKKRSRFSCGLM